MYFLRLIRPINLLIIALTMYGLAWYLDPMHGCSCQYVVRSFSFFLLVISTVMIAAAGNIINDYFDVRADRVNKPNRLVIGKFVKKRVAIVSHWGLNFVAFSIAGYLSWKMESFLYVFIHLLSINLLWYYSLRFKRKFIIGNMMIAALTALVPFLVGIYVYQTNIHGLFILSGDLYPFSDDLYSGKLVLWISLGLAGFAFLLNWAREVVKDLEDIEGDLLLKARTVPIVIGQKKSKWFTGAILLIAVACVLTLWLMFAVFSLKTVLPVIIASIVLIIALFLLVKASEKKHFRTVNHLIKLSMTLGLLTPVYWKILHWYV